MDNSATASDRPPQRIFSLEEANRTLPLVRRIIRDLVDGHHKISELYAEAHRLQEAGRKVKAEEIHGQIQNHLAIVDDFLEELQKIGCDFKDPFQGLVDFPARLDGGRLVYLCWKMGESEIRYWHDLHAGFAGRKPVDGVFTLGIANKAGGVEGS